jgi:tryptophan synthase alpha chain
MKLSEQFDRLRAGSEGALIAYITLGDPSPAESLAIAQSLIDSGAVDVLELGVPFSDPSADGPVIQKAGDKALAFGIGLVQVLDMVRTFRQTNTTTPVVLMGYANPVERYDQKHAKPGVASAFVQDAATAGVDGVLIVDYPPEECEAFAADLRA